MIVALAIAVVVVGFCVVAALRPAAYRVDRSLDITAPAERVFAIVGDVDQLAGVFMLFGEPVDKLVKAGKAKLTIEERVASEKVATKLEITSPMKSTSTGAVTLASTPTGSRVMWSMQGDHNFVGKAFRVIVNTDNMLGADLEKGLAQLKTVAEAADRHIP